MIFNALWREDAWVMKGWVVEEGLLLGLTSPFVFCTFQQSICCWSSCWKRFCLPEEDGGWSQGKALLLPNHCACWSARWGSTQSPRRTLVKLSWGGGHCFLISVIVISLIKGSPKSKHPEIIRGLWDPCFVESSNEQNPHSKYSRAFLANLWAKLGRTDGGLLRTGTRVVP